ncbi:hypothetical protein Ciccas_005373 [Cichlidogyrus casuarinus]|uniref:UBP34/UBP24/USP9X/USP9Y-like ARM repeat region domain-containing protein n=1 Tax=Cichlidogyrus casuarinus TaxID=1844966 RepID=A0ABD2QB49_9PLAT
MRHYFVQPIRRSIWCLSNLSEEVFKQKDIHIFEFLTVVRALAFRLSRVIESVQRDETHERAAFSATFAREPSFKNLPEPWTGEEEASDLYSMDDLHLNIINHTLCPPSGPTFNGRMVAIGHIISELEMARHVQDSLARQEGRLPTVFVVPASSNASSTTDTFAINKLTAKMIDFDHLIEWINLNKVTRKLMENLDNSSYVTRFGQFLRALGQRLTDDDLDDLWNMQFQENAAAMSNIVGLFANIGASSLSHEQLNHLLNNLVRSRWLDLNSDALRVTGHYDFCLSGCTTRPIGTNEQKHAIETLKHNLQCFQTPEVHNIRNARANLLRLITEIATSSKDPIVVKTCLDFLWMLFMGCLEFRQRSNSSQPSKSKFPLRNFARNLSSRLIQASPRPATQKGQVSDQEECDLGYFNSEDVSLKYSRCSVDYSHPESLEAILNQHLIILKEASLSDSERKFRINQFLTQSIDNIKRNYRTYFMLDYLRSLIELCLKTVNLRVKREMIKELNRNLDLVPTILSSIKVYRQLVDTMTVGFWGLDPSGNISSAFLSHASSGSSLASQRTDSQLSLGHVSLVSSQEELSTESHNRSGDASFEKFSSILVLQGQDKERLLKIRQQIVVRNLQLLKLVQMNLDQGIPFEKLRALWGLFLSEENEIPLSERNEFFDWLLDSFSLIESDVQQIFTKLLLKTKPIFLASLPGLQLFRKFFERINLNESKLRIVAKDKWVIEKPELSGLNYLWDLYLTIDPTSNDEVLSKAPRIIPRIFKEEDASRKLLMQTQSMILDVQWILLSSRLRRDPEACHKRFFDLCQAHLDVSYSQLVNLLNLVHPKIIWSKFIQNGFK